MTFEQAVSPVSAMPSIMVMHNELTFLNNLTSNQKKFVLQGQLDVEAIEYSHFDAWVDGSSNSILDDLALWFSDAMVVSRNYHIISMNQLCKTNYKFDQFKTLEPYDFFMHLQAIYTEHGYYVYLSENMIEIYDPEDVSESDLEN